MRSAQCQRARQSRVLSGELQVSMSVRRAEGPGRQKSMAHHRHPEARWRDGRAGRSGGSPVTYQMQLYQNVYPKAYPKPKTEVDPSKTVPRFWIKNRRRRVKRVTRSLFLLYPKTCYRGRVQNVSSLECIKSHVIGSKRLSNEGERENASREVRLIIRFLHTMTSDFLRT